MMAAEAKFVKLTKRSVERIASLDLSKGRWKFGKWMRRERQPAAHMSIEKWLAKGLKGNPMPEKLGNLLLEYLVAKKDWVPGPEKFAVPTEAPAEDVARLPKWSFAALLERLTGPWLPNEENLCHNYEEVELATRMMVEWIGRYTAESKGKSVTNEEARLIGEHEMERTVKDYAKWLFRVWQRWPSTVMFCTVNGVRMGTNISLPLTENGRLKFRSGSCWDMDLTLKDMGVPTRNVLVLMAGEAKVKGVRNIAQSAFAQLLGTSYQFASLCRRMNSKRDRPR